MKNFILSQQKTHTELLRSNQRKRESQEVTDAMLIARIKLSEKAQLGDESFRIHREAWALELGITPIRVKKAVVRLKACGIIIQVERQGSGRVALWKVNPKLKDSAATKELHADLASVLGEAKRTYFRAKYGR